MEQNNNLANLHVQIDFNLFTTLKIKAANSRMSLKKLVEEILRLNADSWSSCNEAEGKK